MNTDMNAKIVAYEQPEVTTPPADPRTVTKRDGSTEPLDVAKLVKWNLWGKEFIKQPVPWQEGVRHVLDSAVDGIKTSTLQDNLIDFFLSKGTWSCNRMAGILYAPIQQKTIFPKGVPTVKEQHDQMVELGLMRPLPYSDEEYEEINKLVDHNRDFNYAHFQIKHIIQKYSLVNHDTGKRYETPQFTYIRMAMALSEDIKPATRRMTFVKDYYELFSDNVLNAPTPNYIYLGTKLNGLVSCCLITSKDTIPSLSTFKTIAYRMTAIGAGIGGMLRSRNFGEKIRNGAILHNGKLPYFRCAAGNVKANMQSGRAGAFTGEYNIFDKEASQLAQLQNPRTPPNRRNRDMHFAVQYHSLFLQKAMLDEDVFTFSCRNAPDLFEAFYSGDKKHFAELYAKYEQDPNFKKEYVNARDLLVTCARQNGEVGTHYEFFADNANNQTPYLEKIYTSNLCMEIMQPCFGYDELNQLFHAGYFGNILVETTTGEQRLLAQDDEYINLETMETVKAGDGMVGLTVTKVTDYDQVTKVAENIFTVKRVVEWDSQPETSFCSLAGIVLPNVTDDAHYNKAMYYALRMIDYCIHKSDYPMPQLAFTAKKRMNAAVGVIGAATMLARAGVWIGTKEGFAYTHEMAERHMYFAIKNSIEIGKELGNAPWMYKTKWPSGWLPSDHYNKSVDEVIVHPNKYDHEFLRRSLRENGGMRFSTLISHMPTESCLSDKETIQTAQGDMTMLDYFVKTSGVSLDQAVQDWEPLIGGTWYDVKNPIQVKTRFGLKDVKRVYYTGLVPVMKVTMDDGQVIECTINHRFLVKTDSGVEIWKRAEELCDGDDVVSIASQPA